MVATVVPTVLNSKNYDDWSSRIKTYLLAKDLWDVLDQERPKTEDEESKAWKKKDAKALYAIQNSCGDDTYKFIKDKTTAKEAWYTLSTMLKKPGEPSDENVSKEKSVLEAYPSPTPTLIEYDTTPEVLAEEGRTGGAGHDEIQETFVKYVKSNDWDNAIQFLRQHPQARSASIPYGSCLNGTVLHYAIWNFKRCSVRVIQQLVELMTKEDLEIPDTFDFTALYNTMTCYPERVELAECMVKKNPNLLNISPTNLNVRPLFFAQIGPKGEGMARCFYSLTPHGTLKVPDAARLISIGFSRQKFDIAWDLIQRYPKLAMEEDYMRNFPLVKLASNPFAFKSGSRLNFWEKLIYYVIRIKPLPLINKDSHINVEKHESEQSDQEHISERKENQSDQEHISERKENQRHLISSGIGLLRGLMTNLQSLLGINRIYQMKLMHERVQQFLPLMCKATSVECMSDYQKKKLKEALCVAVERGHVEYITHLLRDVPYLVMDDWNEEGQNMFQIAAECRRHKVYNLIYAYDQLAKTEEIGIVQPDEIGKRVYSFTDKFGNNLLHTVANITPLSQIDHIRGAALQMQRELQWFKEVESITDHEECESVNKDNKTPRKVFTESHKELMKEAEKSMKETSTSCTVVGALIVTMMFAATFTVPGGNDGKTGLPTFLTKKVFITFIVSDAISLFSSTTSVIMFLGILTSRFSEDDFYKSLPTKMIIGLFTLFLSIATMMIVFSCALYIILDGKSSVVILSIFLAGVPVASFVWMQFSLLVELFISTFGRGIFNRKQKNLF